MLPALIFHSKIGKREKRIVVPTPGTSCFQAVVFQSSRGRKGKKGKEEKKTTPLPCTNCPKPETLAVSLKRVSKRREGKEGDGAWW